MSSKDLSFNIAQNYTVHRQNKGAFSQPRLRIMSNLYDVALASYIPTFVKNGCVQGNIEPKMFIDLLALVPDTTPLQTLVKIETPEFWATKLLLHYQIQLTSDRVQEAKSMYFQQHVQLMLNIQNDSDTRPKLQFEPWTSVDFQLQKLSETFNGINELNISTGPGFKYSEVLSNFKLQRLSLVFNYKKQETVEDALNPKQRHGQWLRSKTLQEIASQKTLDSDSVFPFHELYKPEDMRELEPVHFEESQLLYQMSQRCYMSISDLFNLRKVFTLQTLRELDLVDSGITDELCAQLALIVKDSQLERLDLQNNCIQDPLELLKCCMRLSSQKTEETTAQRHYLMSLDISRNDIREPGCLSLMRAIKQEDFGLKELVLDGNQIGEGFVLILNSVIQTAVKYFNKDLAVLSMAECGLTIKEEHEQVITRVINDTGITRLDLSGNTFEGGLAAAQKLQAYASTNGISLVINGVK